MLFNFKKLEPGQKRAIYITKFKCHWRTLSKLLILQLHVVCLTPLGHALDRDDLVRGKSIFLRSTELLVGLFENA